MGSAAIKVSIYVNEGDEWHHRPLHLEVLRLLHKNAIAGGTVLRAVAGFTGKGGVETTSLVDASAKLPLVIEFIDQEANVTRVMPLLREMAGQRLIVRQRVDIEPVSGAEDELTPISGRTSDPSR
jgi:PII-like signaling protein